MYAMIVRSAHNTSHLSSTQSPSELPARLAAHASLGQRLDLQELRRQRSPSNPLLVGGVSVRFAGRAHRVRQAVYASSLPQAPILQPHAISQTLD
jgi:hypothetical protein